MIGEVADYLLLRHHSAVELVNRAESAALISRTRSGDDRRVVRLHLTHDGARRLEALSALHLEELERLALDVPRAWAGLDPVHRARGFAGSPDRAETAGDAEVDVGIARLDDVPATDAYRVLVDRFWPRGIAKRDAPFEEWSKDVAPSPELRKRHERFPARHSAFARRYREELTQDPAKGALRILRKRAGARKLVPGTATKDLERSGAAVLRDVLGES